MKEQEGYFFEPLSLTGRKKQTRQDIKIRRHGFWDKGVKKSAQCLPLSSDHFRLHGNWILQAVYFCKMVAIFSRHLSFFFQLILYGNLHLLSFHKQCISTRWKRFPTRCNYFRMRWQCFLMRCQRSSTRWNFVEQQIAKFVNMLRATN